MLIIVKQNILFIAKNLQEFFNNHGIVSRIHVISNKLNLEKVLDTLDLEDNKVIVIGHHTLIKLTSLIEEFHHKLPLHKITLWNVDSVPLIYRYINQFRSVNLIHSSSTDALLWKTIFDEDCMYTNGLFDICNISKIPKMNFETFRTGKILFPINLFWGGHDYESFSIEILHGVKDQKLIKYHKDIHEIITIPWQKSLSEYDLDPLNIRHQRATLLLYTLFKRQKLSEFYEYLSNYLNKTKDNFADDFLPDCENKKLQELSIEKTDLKLNYSEFAISTSYTNYFHDRTVRSILNGVFVLEDQFSGYGSEFEKNGIDVIQFSKQGPSINLSIFDQEFNKREKVFEEQVTCTRAILENSNFSVFLNI